MDEIFASAATMTPEVAHEWAIDKAREGRATTVHLHRSHEACSDACYVVRRDDVPAPREADRRNQGASE